MINSVARLYWIAAVARSSSEQRAELSAHLDTIGTIIARTRLHGEKIVKRPGDLSAGEYRVIMKPIGMFYMPDGRELAAGTMTEDMKRWETLASLLATFEYMEEESGSH